MQNNPFLYPGQGIPLRKVDTDTGNVASIPETTSIATTEYTEAVAAHDCIELLFNFAFDAATQAGEEVEIQVSNDREFSDYQTQELVGVSGKINFNWTPGQYLSGFFRVLNVATPNLTVTVQKRIQ